MANLETAIKEGKVIPNRLYKCADGKIVQVKGSEEYKNREVATLEQRVDVKFDFNPSDKFKPSECRAIFSNFE